MVVVGLDVAHELEGLPVSGAEDVAGGRGDENAKGESEVDEEGAGDGLRDHGPPVVAGEAAPGGAAHGHGAHVAEDCGRSIDAGPCCERGEVVQFLLILWHGAQH